MSSALRPQTWEEYIGQEKLKARLQLHIQAAINRNSLLDHLLLVGPPGVGKTSLAQLVAQELQVQLAHYVMPIKQKTLFKLLQGYVGVFVLDEIHRLPKKEQEGLLTVFEDGYIQYDNGAKMPLHGAVTFIGATTEPEKVIKPLFDRFAIRPSFEEYTDEQMAHIVTRMANKVGLYPNFEEALVLGRASAGIPRQARTLVFTARDLGETQPDRVLQICGITSDGLTEHHIDYMTALDSLGKTAGVDLLSNYLRLPKELIIDTERLLIRRRLIEYTAKGRQMTLEGHIVLQKVNQSND